MWRPASAASVIGRKPSSQNADHGGPGVPTDQNWQTLPHYLNPGACWVGIIRDYSMQERRAMTFLKDEVVPSVLPPNKPRLLLNSGRSLQLDAIYTKPQDWSEVYRDMLRPSIESPGWQNSLVAIALGPVEGGKTSFISGLGRVHDLVPTCTGQRQRISAHTQNDLDFGVLHRVLAQISPDVQNSKVHCAISAYRISKANNARLSSTTEEIFDLLSNSRIRLLTRKQGAAEFVLTGVEYLRFMGLSEMQTVLERIKGNRGAGPSDLVIVIVRRPSLLCYPRANVRTTGRRLIQQRLYHGKKPQNAANPKDWLTTEVSQLVFVGEYVLLHHVQNPDHAELGRANSTADLLDFEQHAPLGGQPASKALLKILMSYQAARHVRFLCTSPTEADGNALRGLMIRLPLAKKSHRAQQSPEPSAQRRQSASVQGVRSLIPRPVSSQASYFAPRVQQQQQLQLAQEQQALSEAAAKKEWSRPVFTPVPPTFFRSNQSVHDDSLTPTSGWSSYPVSSTPSPVEGQSLPSFVLGVTTADSTSAPVPLSHSSSEVGKLSRQVSELQSAVGQLADRVQAMESNLERANSWAQALSSTPSHASTQGMDQPAFSPNAAGSPGPAVAVETHSPGGEGNKTGLHLGRRPSMNFSGSW